MPPRIEDVAAHAGVSTKTVSRVLNHQPNVRPRLRVRIEASIRALNYVPNRSARSLAGSRSNLIALLYDNPTAGSSYIMELIVGILQACKSTPYNAVLHPFDSSENLVAAIDGFVAQHRPDAMILVPPHANNVALIRRLDELAIPYATLSSKTRETRCDVGFDERGASAAIVDHLIRLGHRRIGHISGLTGHGARAWRFAGYRDALRRAGIEYEDELVVEGDFMFASGESGAAQLLDLAEPPTAIFAANDDMACGVMREAYRRGLPVPQALSVCGFDDTPASLLMSPGLTTVHQPCRELARVAVEQVLRAIGDPTHNETTRVPYEVRVRASTAAPGKQGKGFDRIE